MKKPVIIALVAVSVVLSGVGIAGYKQNSSEGQDNSQSVVVQEQATPEQDITFSEDNKQVIYDGVADETALVTLQSLTTVETKSTDFGDMVIGINGVTAESNNEYWAFYVNGQMANEGAGTYKTQSGDKIEWKLEKL